jgi:hypothetical protein
MKKIAAIALALLSAGANAHQQHIAESHRRIITDLSVVSVPVTIENTTAQARTYRMYVNEKAIGLPLVIPAESERVQTVYLTMPAGEGGQVHKKVVCSEQEPNEGETLALRICHDLKVYYAR